MKQKIGDTSDERIINLKKKQWQCNCRKQSE